MKTKQANKDCPDLSHFPNFSKTGSIKGMKDKYYGKHALLVRKGAYIYHVDQHTYENHAH